MGEEVKGKEEPEEKMEKLEKMENGGAPPSPAIKYYGWKAMPYIIGNETFEKLGTLGTSSNLLVYLTSVFHIKSVDAATLINAFSGTTSFAPIIGAFLSDAYLGRYTTLAYSSVASLLVSKLGFGCMGLTGSYNSPVSDDVGISIIKHAFDSGVTFFDTSDAYGPFTNEILLGKALKHLPREKVQVATKFGISGKKNVVRVEQVICGKPEYVRACCEASLERLGTEYIDLYYQHRVDTTIPIEETIGELKKLVEEGKVKYIGLSEASPDTIRRAHAVHPITALEMEWSLWTRDIESEIVPLCRELGIGIVAYSPLGRGILGGKGIVEELKAGSILTNHPRYTGENLEKNKSLFSQLESLAKKHKCTTAQLALAWVLHQEINVVPIPGTSKIKNLDSNISALNLKLSDEDMKELTELVSADAVAGGRIYKAFEHANWNYANTPPLNV